MKLGGHGPEEAIGTAQAMTGRAGFVDSLVIEFRFVKVPFLLQIELGTPGMYRASGNL